MNDGSPLKNIRKQNVDQLALEKLDGNQARIREFGNLGNTHKILTDGDGMIRDIGNLCDPGGMRIIRCSAIEGRSPEYPAPALRISPVGACEKGRFLVE